MAHDVMDDLERRLRASRPHAAHADDDAFDAELLARVRDEPIAARRTVPRAVAVPVAASVTLIATAVVMLGGGPGDVGPSSASAVTQALRWLNPPPGTVLHVRSVESAGSQTTTREFWQSADDPTAARLLTDGAQRFETAGDALYDPATDTIYDPPAGRAAAGETAAVKRSLATGGEARAARKPAKLGDAAMPTGDPFVAKTRMLLQEGRMVVSGRAVHNGTDAWKLSLAPRAGRPAWTLWVSVADGKPLELRDPGRDASERPRVIRWRIYQVLPDDGADRLLSLTGAHPNARVVSDPARVAAARQRFDAPR